MAVPGSCVPIPGPQASSSTTYSGLCFFWYLKLMIPWQTMKITVQIWVHWSWVAVRDSTELVHPMLHSPHVAQPRDLSLEQTSNTTQGKQMWNDLPLPFECGDYRCPFLMTTPYSPLLSLMVTRFNAPKENVPSWENWCILKAIRCVFIKEPWQIFPSRPWDWAVREW